MGEFAVVTKMRIRFPIIEFHDGSTACVVHGMFNYPAQNGDYLKVILSPSFRESVYVGEACGIFTGYGLVGDETYFSIDDEVLKIGDTLRCDRIKGEYITPHNFKCNFRCISFEKAADKLEAACSPMEQSINKRGYLANIKNVGPEPDEYTSEIPPELKELVFRNNISDIRRELDNILPSKLNFSTYVKTFRVLLHLEESNEWNESQACKKKEVSFVPEEVSVKIDGKLTQSFVYTMKHERLQDRRPSIVGGNEVRAKCDETEKVFFGIVKRTLPDAVVIKFEQQFIVEFNETQTYEVTFSSSDSGYKKMHLGVDRAVERLGESFLFPNEITVANEVQLDVQLENGVLKLGNTVIPWFEQGLDDSQKGAVVQALRAEFRPLPNIIHGPPGTGKTSTLIEIILHIFTHVKGSRILIATHSNSAANLILARLLEYDVLKAECRRLVSKSYQKKGKFPNELLPFCCALHGGDSGEECEGQQKTKENGGIQIFRELKAMALFRIVIGTCIGLGSLMYDRKKSVPDYTHVVVDEAGQCSEPEVLVPISKLNSKTGSVILAGDAMQLPPLVLSTHAKERGLSLSLLQRFVTRYNNIDETTLTSEGMENLFGPHMISKLLYNYRALPSILDFYNKHFYKDELLATISETCSDEMDALAKIQRIMPNKVWRNSKHAIFFQNVLGNDEQIKDSKSLRNMAEIDAIMAIVPKLLHLGFAGEDIGVITPYHLQVTTLRERFEHNGYPILVGSVDEFQGLERKIILISTVRTGMGMGRKLGLVACSKRTNVAISRARAAVVVFGTATLLEADEYWQALIEDCKANGTFYEYT